MGPESRFWPPLLCHTTRRAPTASRAAKPRDLLGSPWRASGPSILALIVAPHLRILGPIVPPVGLSLPGVPGALPPPFWRLAHGSLGAQYDRLRRFDLGF